MTPTNKLCNACFLLAIPRPLGAVRGALSDPFFHTPFENGGWVKVQD